MHKIQQEKGWYWIEKFTNDDNEELYDEKIRKKIQYVINEDITTRKMDYDIMVFTGRKNIN